MLERWEILSYMNISHSKSFLHIRKYIHQQDFEDYKTKIFYYYCYLKYSLNFQRKYHTVKFDIDYNRSFIIWFPSHKLILLHLQNVREKILVIQLFLNQNFELLMWKYFFYILSIWDTWCCIAVSNLESKSLTYGICFMFLFLRWKKSKCNTATCAVQWLANFLVHSSNNFSVSLSLTNVGSNTYGKRNTVEILNKKTLTDLSL